MYSRKLDGKTLTFGHEGILFRNSFVMYDKGTKSLWIHTMGEAVKGKLKGKQLTFLPSEVTTYAAWKKRHPKTLVLTGKKARGFMGTYALGRRFDRYGLSLGQGRKVKLYPYSLLEKSRVVNDEFGGKKIVVVYDAGSRTGLAFLSGGHRFALKRGKMVDEKGREWDLLGGRRGKESLERIPATPWLILRWKGFYPDGEVYEAPAKEKPAPTRSGPSPRSR